MAYDTKGKKIYSITYGYDQQKMENSVKRKYRVAPEDGIIQSDERKLLDDQGAIVEMLRTIRLKNGKLLNVKSVFEYNDQHLLTSVKKYIENGLETETIYKYFANNRLMITEVHDRNEMLLRVAIKAFWNNPGMNFLVFTKTFKRCSQYLFSQRYLRALSPNLTPSISS